MSSGEDAQGGPIGYTMTGRPIGHMLPTRSRRRIVPEPERRRCAADRCDTWLRRGNGGDYCSLHEHQQREPDPIPTMQFGRSRIAGVPVPAVVDLLDDTCASFDHFDPAGGGMRGGIVVAAQLLGTSPRRLTDYLAGRRKMMMPDLLDRLLIVAGLEHTRHQYECLA